MYHYVQVDDMEAPAGTQLYLFHNRHLAEAFATIQ